MTGRENPILALIQFLHEMESDVLAAQAEAGCTVPHRETVHMECRHCGWHEHACPECGHIWDHDARVRFGTEEEYDRDHRCPECDAPQRWKRQRTPSSAVEEPRYIGL